MLNRLSSQANSTASPKQFTDMGFIFDVENTLVPNTEKVYVDAVMGCPEAKELFEKTHGKDMEKFRLGLTDLAGQPLDIYLRYILGFGYQEPLEKLGLISQKLMDEVVKRWNQSFAVFLEKDFFQEKIYAPYKAMPELLKYLVCDEKIPLAYASGCGQATALLKKASLLQYMQGGIVPTDMKVHDYVAAPQPKIKYFSIAHKPYADIYELAAKEILNKEPEVCALVDDAEKIARTDNPDSKRFAKFKAILLITEKKETDFQKGELLPNVILVKGPQNLLTRIDEFIHKQKSSMHVASQPNSKEEEHKEQSPSLSMHGT